MEWIKSVLVWLLKKEAQNASIFILLRKEGK